MAESIPNPEPLPNPAEYLDGTFRGVSPTDESAVGMGEIEMSFGDGVMRIRMATGLGYYEDSSSMDILRPMSQAELAEMFADGVDTDGLVGFTTNQGTGLPDDGNITYVLDTRAHERDADAVTGIQPPALQRFGGMGDLLGPTILFSEMQIEHGHFTAAIKVIEHELGHPGDIPRIADQTKLLDYDY